ncbi:MAG TPA: cytochrome c3 family protein [Blastocatellia bacterium]|nr:cytochrome c3 family protein [Blastocatellia bacterium]
MRFKLAIIALYAVAVATPAILMAQTAAPQRDCLSQPEVCNDAANKVIKLDLNGRRGVVCFRHRTHEAFLNPNAAFAHQEGMKGAECIGCHHKRDENTGTPILDKCTVCHRGEGFRGENALGLKENPRNTEGDEMWRERAYHELCIGCHRASNEQGKSKCKAPVACSECHAPKFGG